MNEQFAKPVVSPQKLVAIALVVAIAIVLGVLSVYEIRKPDPYAREVLALQGDSIQGHAIFQINCSGCHGIMADGRVGPSLKGISTRKSRARLIDQVISGETPPMPKFQPSQKEMADLLSYLESL